MRLGRDVGVEVALDADVDALLRAVLDRVGPHDGRPDDGLGDDRDHLADACARTMS